MACELQRMQHVLTEVIGEMVRERGGAHGNVQELAGTIAALLKAPPPTVDPEQPESNEAATKLLALAEKVRGSPIRHDSTPLSRKEIAGYAAIWDNLSEIRTQVSQKPHEVVAAWRGNPQFSAIARRARDLAQSGLLPNAIRTQITQEFGAASLTTAVTPLRSPAHAAPIHVVGSHLIQANAIEQAQMFARLPPVVSMAIAPDAHWGFGVPIGTTALMRGAISPSAVGVDIGCSVKATMIKMSHAKARLMMDALTTALCDASAFGVDLHPTDHPIVNDPRWDEQAVLRNLKDVARRQLGSQGGGNHFANVMLLEQDGEEYVVLLTHSGSRKVGAVVAEHFIALADAAVGAGTKAPNAPPKGYGWLNLADPEGQNYVHAMGLCIDYARANHDAIHARFLRHLKLSPETEIMTTHNAAWVNGQDVLVRKGATPAESGVLGIIPGSMLTPAAVVVGRGNLDALQSASHGAGRVGSRGDRLRQMSYDEYRKAVDASPVRVLGGDPSEHSSAYKPIEEVLAVQVAEQVIDVKAMMHPFIVRMAEPETRLRRR